MNELIYRIRRFLFQEYTPITKGSIVFTAVFFFVSGIFSFLRLNELFQLNGGSFLIFPWTLLTYPLVNQDFLSLFFGLFWFWSVGGSLERNFGGKTYAFFLSLVTVVTGLALVIVDQLFVGADSSYQGIWLLLTGVTWAWARINPHQDSLLFGLIPMQSKWMAWLVAGLIFSSYVTKHPLIALASLSGIPVVYLFTDRGPWTRSFYSKGWRQGRNSSSRESNLKQKNRRSRLRIVK